MLGEVRSDNSLNHGSLSELSSPAFRAALEWIQKILGISIPQKDDFRSVLSSGEILCNLLNAIAPGGIKRINRCPNRASAIDNLSLFLSACEDKCGIPRSQLFSIDDFEDIFDRKLEATTADERDVKRSEKVVVSLLWLAKYADRTPKCKHLPKLDYEAFLGLLPKTFIRSSALFSVRENFSLESKSPQPVEESPQKSNPDKEHIPQQSQLPLSEISESGPPTQKACSFMTMGNFQSAASPPAVIQKEPILRNSPSPPCEQPSEQQTNNNGIEEDEWQTDLLDWREKRRKFSRMHATKMMTLEEVQQEEELKRQEAVKDRMRQIKAQRSLGADQYIPSSSILRPIPPSSPGMALLIGGGSEFFDNSDDLVSSETKAVGEISGQTDESSASFSAPVAIKSAPPHINGFHEMVPDIVHEPTDATDIDQVEENVCGSALMTPNPDSHATDPRFVLTAENGFREVRVYIQSNSKSVEPRWGMTIRAEGPSRTAPFVVDRVKIGSTADVCEVTKGDVLLKLNGTDLRWNPYSEKAYTMQELELLMDQCSLSNKPVDLRLLRRKSQNDDLSDCDIENEAIVDGLNGEHSPAYTSDVDNPESHEDVLALDRVVLPQERQPVPDDVRLKSCNKVVTPESNGPVGQESSSSSPRCSSESRTEAEHWTLDLPLKKSLKAQIVNTSEVGASYLQSPTQSDGSSASQLVSIRGSFKTDVGNTEPIAVSVGARDVREIKERVLLIRQPSVDISEVKTTPLVLDNSVENTHVPSTGTPVTYAPHSPLPPPPLLPLNVTWSPDPSIHMQSSPSKAKYSFYDHDKRKIDLNTAFDPSTLILPDCTYSHVLPSPPPLQLFPKNMHTCTLSESAIYPFVGPTASECLTRASGRELSVTSTGAHYPVSRKTTSTASGDLQTHLGGLSTSRCTRVLIIPNSESEITLSSHCAPYIPPPAPSAPLLALSTSGSSIPPSQYSQANGASKFSTYHLVDNRDESTQGSLAQRCLHPSTHPFPPMATEAPPPQPPRVPLNRGVNPKNKCNACNQELGTGDLMIINSMGLYYHLACFVCSRCGVPLSDGLSNAEVRIRSGQLYCQLCYPSKSGRQKMVPQGDSDRRSPTQRRHDPQYACSDRRQRPRGSSIHSSESGSRMSPRSYF